MITQKLDPLLPQSTKLAAAEKPTKAGLIPGQTRRNKEKTVDAGTQAKKMIEKNATRDKAEEESREGPVAHPQKRKHT